MKEFSCKHLPFLLLFLYRLDIFVKVSRESVVTYTRYGTKTKCEVR